MGLKLRIPNVVLIMSLAAALFLAGCSQEQAGGNKSNTNSAATQSADKKGGTPADAQLVVPGFFQSGPTGDVSLSFTTPLDDQVIQENSIAPAFNISGYPIYKDAERNKGQHIHVIIDNEPYEADYDPQTPFSHDRLKNLKEGAHTLRAFPGREWHESIKETDGSPFAFHVFHVKSKTASLAIDKKAPLLTYSRPKGEYRWKDDPRGLMLDFYVTNAPIGLNDYRVRYTLDGAKTEVLTRWEPVWWRWEDLTSGEHKVVLELLDKNGKPVPFKVGNVDYNRTERTFKILGEGEAAGSGAAGNSNKPH
jgi:hypothetical protein